jgi:hypothetical protein
MNKMNMTLLILAIFSTTTVTGYALTTDTGSKISTNDTIVNSESTNDTIVVNENARVINITENSNETTVMESIIKQEQKKSTPGFGLEDTLISLITVMFLIMAIDPFKKQVNRGVNTVEKKIL